MKHKILELKGQFNEVENCEAVALNIVREEGDFVRISAWHEKDGEMLYQVENISLPSFAMGERFIKDFTPDSAQIFAKNFTFLSGEKSDEKTIKN